MKKLYYEDCNLQIFSATVTGCEPEGQRWRVTLDQTAFYPEGGGQACDVGTLGEAKVLDVQEMGEEVCHFCDRPLPVGATVQGKIDWQQVADAGVEFVMIRVGYRGYDTGLLHQDERAQENYEGAHAAGLSVGAYFFSQAMTPSEAAQEARLALMMVDGWELTLPLVFDWEYVSEDARTALATQQIVTACAKAFCSAVEQAGHKSMIYCNPHVAETYLDLDTLADRDIWLALYADTLSYPYRVAMWQYTQTGEVPGIREKVDINILLP